MHPDPRRRRLHEGVRRSSASGATCASTASAPAPTRSCSTSPLVASSPTSQGRDRRQMGCSYDRGRRGRKSPPPFSDEHAPLRESIRRRKPPSCARTPPRVARARWFPDYVFNIAQHGYLGPEVPRGVGRARAATTSTRRSSARATVRLRRGGRRRRRDIGIATPPIASSAPRSRVSATSPRRSPARRSPWRSPAGRRVHVARASRPTPTRSTGTAAGSSTAQDVHHQRRARALRSTSGQTTSEGGHPWAELSLPSSARTAWSVPRRSEELGWRRPTC